MKAKLILIPFRKLHPKASPKYEGYHAMIARFDPKAKEITWDEIRAAMTRNFTNVLSLAGGRRYGGPAVPSTITLRIVTRDCRRTDTGDHRGTERMFNPVASRVSVQLADIAEVPLRTAIERGRSSIARKALKQLLALRKRDAR